MRRVALLGLISCLVACPARGGSECDKDKLRALSVELQGLSPDADVAPVMGPGLEGACGEALPQPPRLVLDLRGGPLDQRATSLERKRDERWAAMLERACPEAEKTMRAIADAPFDMRGLAAYQGCGFERFDLMSEEEAKQQHGLIAWTMHQWFLDQGLSADEARPLTEALFLLERRSWTLIFPLDGQKIPLGAGDEIESGAAIYVGLEELSFNEQKMASMHDGRVASDEVKNHLVESLYDALAEEADMSKQLAKQRGEEWDARAILVVDERVPFSTLVDVLYTAGRAEYYRYALVVQERPWEFKQIALQPPEFRVNPEPGEVDATPVMTMEVGTSSISVRNSDPLSSGEAQTSHDDLQPVSTFAEMLKTSSPGAHRTVVTATNEVPIGQVVAAIVAARGPDCAVEESKCFLPDVIVTAGSAHGYRPEGYKAQTADQFENLDGGPELGALLDSGGGLGMTKGSGLSGAPRSRVAVESIEVDGDLDKELVRRLIRRQKPRIDACYAEARQDDPTLGGKMHLEITVDDKGMVKSAEASTEVGEVFSECIEERALEWVFPPRYSMKVDVAWVLSFE